MSVASVEFGALNQSWFEPVGQLKMSSRPKFERGGLVFTPEEEEPFSFDAGPVVSVGARLDDGTEFWIWADWLWSEGTFSAPPLDSREHHIVVQASPEQVASPSDAFRSFAYAIGIAQDETEWVQTEWPELTLEELERRRTP